MDMAVGVIIGGAFKAIVDSLTADIIMPIIGIFVGADTFADKAVTVGKATITYGNFIQAILNFLIMAFVVFCIVKAFNNMRKKEEEPAEEPAPPEPTKEELLLTEIRDLLKQEK